MRQSYSWARLFGAPSHKSALDFVPSIMGIFGRPDRELINGLLVKGYLWLLCENRL